MCMNNEKATSEKVKTNREPSYTVMFLLSELIVVFAVIIAILLICFSIKYKKAQTDLAEVKQALLILEQYAENDPAAEEGGTILKVEINYPDALMDDTTELSDVISIVQTDNAHALSAINNNLVLFSVLITAVVIIVPLFNYWFIQKDQVVRLNRQYYDYKKDSTAELTAIKESSRNEIERLDGLYRENSKKSNEAIERMQKYIELLIGVLNAKTNLYKNSKTINIEKFERFDIASNDTAQKDAAFAYYINAKLHYENKNYDQALQEVNKAINLEPSNVIYSNTKEMILSAMGRYVITYSKNGPYFVLKAGNGEIIGKSEAYSSVATCKNGIESIRKNAPIANLEDQTVEGWEKAKNPVFEMYKDKSDEYRFRLRAKNGEPILASEGYTTKASCQKGIESVKKNAGSRIVEE